MGFVDNIKKIFRWETVNGNGGLPSTGSRENKHEAIRNATIETQTDLKKIIESVDDIKDFYMSKLIVNRIIDDAINPSADSENLFTVNIVDDEDNTNEKLTRISNKFKKEFNIEKLITDISPDIVSYGFHYIRLDVNAKDEGAKGIINIHDDVTPEKIIPIFRDNQVAYFNRIQNDGTIVKEPAYKYVFFNYSQRRKKVQTHLNDTDAVYFRLGEGVLHPVLSQLKNLFLLEGVSYINILKQTVKQPILTVSVPDKTKPEEAVKIAQTYEKLINKNLNSMDIDFNNVNKTLNDVLTSAGKVKVLPGWGDKGAVEKTEFGDRTDYDSNLKDKIQDLRTTILQTEGMSQQILETGMTRVDNIQQSVRYAKKIKTFQNSLVRSIKQIFLIHLQNNGYNLTHENIKISINGVVNLHDLEKIEYLNMSLELMDNVNSFISDVRDASDTSHTKIKEDVLAKFYNKTFNKILGEDIFYNDKDKKQNEV